MPVLTKIRALGLTGVWLPDPVLKNTYTGYQDSLPVLCNAISVQTHFCCFAIIQDLYNICHLSHCMKMIIDCFHWTDSILSLLVIYTPYTAGNGGQDYVPPERNSLFLKVCWVSLTTSALCAFIEMSLSPDTWQ